MGYELVPAYLAADPGGQATLAATADSFAATALVTNTTGNFLGFGVVVPLYAWPSLPRALPLDRMAWSARRGARWMVGAAQPRVIGDREHLQHRLHRLLRFMLSMGIALLRLRSQLDEATQASTQTPS